MGIMNIQKQTETMDGWIAKAYNEKLCQLPWCIPVQEMLLAKLACKKALEGKNVVILSPSFFNARDIVKEIKKVPVAANWICEIHQDRVRFISEGTITVRSIHNTMAILGLNCDCLYMLISIKSFNEFDQWLQSARYLCSKEQIVFFCNDTSINENEFIGCVPKE
jgi:hypothetical protein